MPEPMPAWRPLEREVVHDCRVFKVCRTAARNPRSDETLDFFTLDAPDWVNVVPVTPAGDIVIVRQYRHGARGTTLEIPGGMVDPGESPAQAAARELLEETGYAAEALEELGSVNPNPALFANRCTSFLARDARAVAGILNQGDEETRVEIVAAADVPGLLRAGEIDHALVVAAFHWAHLHLGS